MESPLITAVIPVYNRPVQVVEAAASVFKQTYRPLQLLVGDDGSDDETVQVLEEWAAALPGNEDFSFEILQFTHNGFPGAVRNACVKLAKGDWLAFLDSDDLWEPRKLESQFGQLHRDQPENLISHTREKWMRNGKEISQSGMKHMREGLIFEDALKKCIIGPSTVMISRELYDWSGGFRDDLEIAEDYEYWLRLTAQHPVAYLEEALTIKQAGHGDQLSEKYGQIEIFRIDGLKDLVDRDFFPADCQIAAVRELSRKCLVYSKGCRKRGRIDEADKYEALAEQYKDKEQK